jgi:TolB-like protein/DNA-binding winged helix-turn-helix (wHTH) protein/Tfp pilus assembly protein PilF
MEGVLSGDAGQRRLQPRQMDVLMALVAHAGEVVTREVLLNDLWGGRAMTDEPLTRCVAELRQQLGDSRSEPRYIQTIPKRGYRLVAEVTPLDDEPDEERAVHAPPPSPPPFPSIEDTATAPAAGTTSLATTPRPHKVLPLHLLAVVVLVVLLVIVSLFVDRSGLQSRHASQAKDHPLRTAIAVLPFEGIGAEAQSALIDGIHDDIVTQLGTVRSLTVISRTSVVEYRGSKLPLRQIGAELGVGSILRGDVQRSGDRIRVNVQLLDAQSEAHLWAHSYDAALTADNVFDIQRRIATELAAALQVALLPQEREQLATTPTSNLDALLAYQAGRQSADARTQDGLQTAVRSFEHAIELDGNFAPAYAALAQANLNLLTLGGDASVLMPRTVRAAQRALELDDRLGDAHAVLGTVAGLSGDFDVVRTEFEQAVALSPNSAEVHYLYAHTLDESLGRPDEALPEFEKAQTLDPRSPVIIAYHGLCLATVGRTDEGLDQLARARALDPQAVYPYALTGNVYWYGLARGADALEWYRKAAALDAGSASWIATVGSVYMNLGDTAEAEKWIDYALSLEPDNGWANVYKALLLLERHEDEIAAQHAEAALRAGPRDVVALGILRTIDFGAGRVDRALERYRAHFPELFAGATPAVETENMEAAIDIALLWQAQHDDARAQALLDAAEAVWAAEPSHALIDYPADVHILALRGRDDDALAALRKAVDAGWRELWQFDLAQNPNLARLHERPELIGIAQRLGREMAEQAQQARDREARGEYARILPD